MSKQTIIKACNSVVRLNVTMNKGIVA